MRYLWGFILVILSACGTSVSSREKLARDITISSPFSVASFSPAAGAVAALPATVTVFFNNIPNRLSASALTHYNLSCGGTPAAAQDVDYESGYSSITVTLPGMGTLSAGTVCTLTVSANLVDTAGNPLGGERGVSYTISP